jgi:hypothetical protein
LTALWDDNRMAVHSDSTAAGGRRFLRSGALRHFGMTTMIEEFDRDEALDRATRASTTCSVTNESSTLKRWSAINEKAIRPTQIV